MSGRWLLAAALCALAYLLVDGHPESLLSGLPWRPASLMVAALGGIVAWVVWPKVNPTPPPRRGANILRLASSLRTYAGVLPHGDGEGEMFRGSMNRTRTGPVRGAYPPGSKVQTA